jgi:alpha-glucosidase
MNQYRDFDNDQNRFGYSEGAQFLSKIHANGQHYIPIVDSAIYVPNPENASDAYPTFNRGNESSAFMLNEDGSLYVGDVWPGYTVFPGELLALLHTGFQLCCFDGSESEGYSGLAVSVCQRSLTPQFL